VTVEALDVPGTDTANLASVAASRLLQLWRWLTWNPVATREARACLRSKKTVVIALVIAASVGLLGFLGFTGIESSSVDAAVRDSTGSLLFTGFATTSAVALLVAATATTAPCISRERERGTLELLIAAGISPARVIVGKLAGSLASIAVLASGCLPLFCLAFLLGGPSSSEAMETLGAIAAGVVAVTALAMTASVCARSTTGATIGAIVLTLAIAAGPIAGAYLQAALSNPVSPVVSYSTAGAVSPVMDVIDVIDATTSCGITGLTMPVTGNLVPQPADICAGADPATVQIGPLGTWQAWEAGSAADGAIALCALAVSAVVFRRQTWRMP